MSAATFECACGWVLYEAPDAEWWETDEVIEDHTTWCEQRDARVIEHVGDRVPDAPTASPWPAVVSTVQVRSIGCPAHPWGTVEPCDECAAERGEVARAIAADASALAAAKPTRTGWAWAQDIAAFVMVVAVGLAGVLYVIGEVLP